MYEPVVRVDGGEGDEAVGVGVVEGDFISFGWAVGIEKIFEVDKSLTKVYLLFNDHWLMGFLPFEHKGLYRSLGIYNALKH
jgi:hypothetical protein